MTVDTIKLQRLQASRAGGKTTGLLMKAKALQSKMSYNENPAHCFMCKSAILVDLQAGGHEFQQVKRKKFCTHSCSAQYNNLQRGKKPLTCTHCNTPVSRGRICDDCKSKNTKPTWTDTVANLTKQEVFARCKNWQSARTIIRQHAADTYEKSGRPKVCKVCGYFHHAPICHIIPVADFPGAALVREINDLSNLVALCPNHHWEFDHGVLSKELVAGAGLEPAASSL